MAHRNYLFIIGMLVVIVGAFPFIKQIGFISGYIEIIPSSGLIYQIVIMALGFIAILLSTVKRRPYFAG